ncbi:MAG: hypothetical protein DRN06_05635 [Thermoprotei archaeon]|nr:MAG: hypothetical protein DRN06_05635 [Thermoprotei archaeon]
MKAYSPYLLPLKRDDFKKILRGAMLSYTPEHYSTITLFGSASSSIAGYVITLMPKFKFMFPLLPLLFPLVTYAFFTTYPAIRMKSRKTKIDLKLPHAITYMQAFCEVLPLYEIFKMIYREKDIYGEVSEEFGFIVRDVELFGDDIVSAMRNLANSTPSENLKEFLEGLIMAFESGGSLKDYMLTKIDHFRERARRQSELNLKTLEILAEVYVVMFVALPIFLIVVIFAMQIAGKGVGYEYYFYLYVFLPIGSLLLIFIVDTVNVKEDLSVTRIIRRRSYYPASIVSSRIRHDVKVKERKDIRDLVASIFTAIKKNYYNSLYFSCVAVAPFLVLYYKNFIKLKFFESLVASLLVLSCIPLLIAMEYRARLVRRVEKDIPNLLREILNLKDVGVSLHEVVRIIKDSKIGILSRELRLAYTEMEWGETVIDALLEVVNRVGTASIRRVISLLINASQATENLREVLLTTIEDFEFGLKLKGERFVTGLSYLFIVYLSFCIFLYTIYSINTSFLASFAEFGVVSFSGLDLMYRISIMLAVFSGIIAGQMEKGHILHGLKHMCVFVVSSVILFEFVLGG